MSKTILFAQYHGWRAHHAPAGGKAGRVDHEQVGAGFPDLWLIRPPRLVIAELKAEKAPARVPVVERHLLDRRPEWLRDLAVTHDQAAWLEALRAVQHALDMWLPDSDQMEGGDPLVPTLPSIEVFLWRPSQWGEIEWVLRRTSWEED